MDTIILKIYGAEHFRISRKSLFFPELSRRSLKDLSFHERMSKRFYLRSFRIQTTQRETYIPRVEVFEKLSKDRKKVCYVLKIEFSAPKLLYWNSLQEVGENDEKKVILALIKALQSVGVHIKEEVLINAIVSGVHACKNVPLPVTLRMRELINELSKVNLSKAYDVSEKQCKKGSKLLNLFSGTIDWSIYDKISDSLRPKVKRTDKNYIPYERAIVEKYGLSHREVFRYEYRLKKTQTVKREINTLLGREYKTPVTLKDLFTPNLQKALVLNSWSKLIKLPENQIALFGPIDPLKLFLHILSRMKEIKKNAHGMNAAFISYGLATATRDFGAKEVRGAVSDIWDTDHSERFSKKIKLAADLIGDLPYSNGIAFIDAELNKYELITLNTLENGI